MCLDCEIEEKEATPSSFTVQAGGETSTELLSPAWVATVSRSVWGSAEAELHERPRGSPGPFPSALTGSRGCGSSKRSSSRRMATLGEGEDGGEFAVRLAASQSASKSFMRIMWDWRNICRMQSGGRSGGRPSGGAIKQRVGESEG